ncbi:MAG: hypothetical protein ACRBBN_09635 [Methyloligellaceae bacterium]
MKITPNVCPKYLLGTQALITLISGQDETFASWVKDILKQSGNIFISTASILQIHNIISSNADEETIWRFENTRNDFMQYNCIWPIMTEHERMARQDLNFRFIWHNLEGEETDIPFMERLVIAAAIEGYLDNPMFFVNIRQPGYIKIKLRYKNRFKFLTTDKL